MTRDVALYISDIVENMDAAVRFIGPMTYEQFVADERTNYAVVRCWEIIGEAVKNVPQDVRDRRPELPWKDLAGMRDKCIHMYFGVNYRRVWQAVKDDIPRIRPQAKSLLDELQALQK
jgi:uncharacterized protein with HEPN domain